VGVLGPLERDVKVARAPRQREAAAAGAGTASVDGLRSGAVRILQELAARSPAGYSRPQVGALTQFSHKGGTFGTYFSDLRRAGFIEERGGLVYATEAGIRALGSDVPPTPKTHAEVMTLWRRALRSGAFAMLEAVVEEAEAGMSREAARRVGRHGRQRRDLRHLPVRPAAQWPGHRARSPRVRQRHPVPEMSDLTRQQLCAELQVSESTVRRWEVDGAPYTPVGLRGKRYDLAEIKAWLRGRGCQPGSTKTAAGTSASWSAANAFTESYRRAQLRVVPSN
jgi:hypothetical protein